MGITKVGGKIGGIDVNINISRDKSLDNVTRDPRLRQNNGKPGVNPNSVLGQFLAKVNKADGFSRPNRFYINIRPPKAMRASATNLQTLDEFKGFPNYKFDTSSVARDVQAFCSKIDIPDRTMGTKAYKIGNGPPRNIVNDVTYADITATFYCDKLMIERNFFELWQQCAYNKESYNYDYYDNYVGEIEIFQLGSFTENQNGDDIAHAVLLEECYPKSVGSVNLGFSEGKNQIATITVTFSYRQWTNYTIDNMGEVHGRGGNDTANKYTVVEKQGGFITGMMKKLPPILRRPARQITEELVRRTPIGIITNGRVSEPFKVPVGIY